MELTKAGKHTAYHKALDLFAQREFAAALGVALESAARGETESHDIVALIYERGGDGVAQDYRAAIEHYRIAYKKRRLVEAALGFARIQFEGPEEVRNYVEAFETYQELVHKNGDPIAMINLGRLLTHGWGCEVDHERARALFERAIEAGYYFGHTYLALLEWKEKHYWRSIKHRYLALRQMMRLERTSPRDRRRRRI